MNPSVAIITHDRRSKTRLGLQLAIVQQGGDFSMAYVQSPGALGTKSPPPPGCSSQFSGHCLDGKHM